MKNWTPIIASIVNIKTKKMNTLKRPGMDAITVLMSIRIFSNLFIDRSGRIIRIVLNTLRLL
jgi:hypothetical protein